MSDRTYQTVIIQIDGTTEVRSLTFAGIQEACRLSNQQGRSIVQIVEVTVNGHLCEAFVNEESKLVGSNADFNEKATTFYHETHEWARSGRYYDEIWGPMVVIGPLKGEYNTDLAQPVIDFLTGGTA